MLQNHAPGGLVVSAFGKLPGLDDFIKLGTNAEANTRLDAWVQGGMRTSKQLLATQWEALYDANLNHHFLFRQTDTNQTQVGTIRAAMDRHRRRFPIVAHTTMDSHWLDRHPAWAMAAVEPIHLALEQNIQRAALLTQVADVERELLTPPPFMPIPENFDMRYFNFIQEVTCGEMHGPEGEPGEAILTQIIGNLSSFVGRPERLPLSIEFPLNQAPFARSLEIRFWMELSMMLLAWYPAEISLFWAAGPSASRFSSVIWSPKQPASNLFSALIHPQNPTHGIWRPWKPSAQRIQGYQRRINLLAEHSLLGLLSFLQPGYPNSCPWYHRN